MSNVDTAVEITAQILEAYADYERENVESHLRYIMAVWEYVEDFTDEINEYLDGAYPGWSVIGCGSYRVALRNGDRVYKVDIDCGGNDAEINTYQHILDQYPECVSQSIRPVVTMWEYAINGEPVVIQEYIECDEHWINVYDHEVDIEWVTILCDGLQGGRREGIGYIWDLQF